MDNPYFLGSLVGLASALIGILVKHFLDKTRTFQIAERTIRQAAIEKFRAAIAQEIGLWYSASKEHAVFTAYFTLRDSSITAEVVEFRPFVKKRVDEYDKAHYNYEKHKEDSLSMVFSGYPKGVKLLEKLLSFTE